MTPELRAANNLLTIDGQSLCNHPPETRLDTQLPALLPGLPMVTVAVDGESWTVLATLNIEDRRDRFARAAVNSGIILIGGQSDIFEEGNTGQQIYDDMVAYAQSATAAGFAWVIGTTIPPATAFWYDAAENTERLAANVLILADTTNFVSVVDIANTPGIDVAGVNYSDGIHWDATGVGIAAAAMAPFIEAELT